MLKNSANLSPRQLAALTALTIAVPISIGFFYFHLEWQTAFIWFVCIFIGSYFIILNAHERFIYRKIKLIYKLIYQIKASKREEFYYEKVLPKKSIAEVTQDVERWAMQRNTEIDDLRKNERFRREFLQNLSHELKTPLFAIQGYVHTLQSGAVHNNEVNMRFLENADKNVDRLVALVEGLDEISKLESGELQLSFSKFNIHDLINEVFELMEIRLAEKNLKAQIKKDSEPGKMVHADKNKIKQVIINLIDNAIKYSKDGGLIEGSVHKLEHNRVLVEISDNGMGIAEEHLARVFERFYRTDMARNRKIGGTGLGLSISKHIIEAHKQSIHVRSKPGVGTTFGFTLDS